MTDYSPYEQIRLLRKEIDKLSRKIAFGGSRTLSSTTNEVPFNGGNTIIPDHIVTGAYVLGVDTSVSSIPGSTSYMRIKADGSHMPDFSAFKLQSGDYDNTLNVWNSVYMFYDGVDYLISFTQPQPIAGIVTLATPSPLSATAVGGSQVNLTWTNVANESGYEIQRSINFNYAGATTINSSAANVAAYTDSTGLSPTTTYYYRIRAKGNGTTFNDSDWATTSATTGAAGLTIATANWDSRFDTADTTIHPSGALVDAGGGLSNRLKDLIHNLDTSHDLSQSTGGNQPTIVTSGINGQKSILVDAGKYFIQTISTYTGDLTTFCVLQPKTAITTFAYYFAGSNSRFDFFHGNGTNFGGGAVAGIYTGNGSPIYPPTPTTLLINTTYVICMRRINSTNTFSLFINGTKVMDQVVSGTNHLTWEGMFLGHPTDSSPCWIREGGTILSAVNDAGCISLSNEYKTRNGL